TLEEAPVLPLLEAERALDQAEALRLLDVGVVLADQILVEQRARAHLERDAFEVLCSPGFVISFVDFSRSPRAKPKPSGSRLSSTSCSWRFAQRRRRSPRWAFPRSAWCSVITARWAWWAAWRSAVSCGVCAPRR